MRDNNVWEYDNYPVPEKVIPLTDDNREEYEKIRQKIQEVVQESLKKLGWSE